MFHLRVGKCGVPYMGGASKGLLQEVLSAATARGSILPVVLSVCLTGDISSLLETACWLALNLIVIIPLVLSEVLHSLVDMIREFDNGQHSSFKKNMGF